MKTLREMLLEKHRSVEPRLDLVRKKALDGLEPGVAIPDQAGRYTPWLSWLLSLRWHLAGLSAAWVLVACLNSEKQAPAQSTGLIAENSSAQYVLLALKENRRQLLELIESPAPQTIPQPRRRSELQPSTEMV